MLAIITNQYLALLTCTLLIALYQLDNLPIKMGWLGLFIPLNYVKVHRPSVIYAAILRYNKSITNIDTFLIGGLTLSILEEFAEVILDRERVLAIETINVAPTYEQYLILVNKTQWHHLIFHFVSQTKQWNRNYSDKILDFPFSQFPQL